MRDSVSIIIPAYQSAATIRYALASVAAQTVKPLEAIVIDDGSSDGSTDIAEAMRGEMNGIDLVVIRQTNKGAGAARNAGCRIAKGEWLAFLDADDAWLPEKLERSLAHAEGASLIAHDFIEVKGSAETYRDSTRHFKAAADPFAALMLRGFIPTSTVLAKRQDVLEVGGFEESLPAAQDYDLWLKLLERPGTRLRMFPEALTRYAVNPGGITSQVERRLDCSLRVLERHVESLRHNVERIVFLRILIVHYEAFSAYLSQGRWGQALLVLAKTPARLVSALIPAQFWMMSALAWMAFVMGFYYFDNAGYYKEKLGMFLSYFLKLS
ncbi:MAG: glycosyltransferase family 2 protein [Rhodospirillales bacterium]|nr:MAG: glycosyltransferase family 2 protein [Rhodospirillales bacterium]